MKSGRRKTSLRGDRRVAGGSGVSGGSGGRTVPAALPGAGGGVSLEIDGDVRPGFYLTLALTAAMPLAAAGLKVGEGSGLTNNSGIMWFGLLVFGTLLAVVVDQLRQGGLELRGVWLMGAMGLFAAAAIISAVYAEGLYLARLGAFRTSLGAVYLLCVLMTADKPWKRRWLLCALVAGGIAVGLGVVISGQMDQAATIEHFRLNRLEILSQMNIRPGSSDEMRFVARLESDLPSTFYHPNLMSSYLMTACVVGLGLVLGRVRQGWQRRSWDFVAALLLVGMMGAMVWAMWLARSRGALGSLGVGLVVMGLVWLGGRWRRGQRFRWGRWLGVGAVIVGVLAVAALPAVIMTASAGPDAEATAVGRAMKTLAFRGDYWRASAGIIGEHKWSGTGSENFGQYYPQYKAAHATEEVADPHNAFVWSAASMGVTGFVAMAALLVVTVGLGLRAAWVGAPAVAAPAGSAAAVGGEVEEREVLPGRRQVVFALLATLPVIVLMHAQGPYSAVVSAIYWVAAFLMLIRGERGNGLLAAGLVAGIIGWWMNAMIDMNYRELPNLAALLLPAAVLGLMFGGRVWRKSIGGDRWMMVLGPLLVVGLGAVLGLMVPVLRATAAVEQAKLLEGRRQGTSVAHRELLERAARIDADWPEPHGMLARHYWLLAMRAASAGERVEHLDGAGRSLRRQLALDPRSLRGWRLLGQVELARAKALEVMISEGVVGADVGELQIGRASCRERV